MLVQQELQKIVVDEMLRVEKLAPLELPFSTAIVHRQLVSFLQIAVHPVLVVVTRGQVFVLKILVVGVLLLTSRVAGRLVVE